MGKNLYSFFQAVSGEIGKLIGDCQGKTSVCYPRSFPSVIPAVCSGDPSCCFRQGVEKMDARYGPRLRVVALWRVDTDMTGRRCTDLDQVH